MEHQEAYEELTRMQRIERGKTIIQQKMGLLSVRPYRTDGYVNVLNRFGTSKDSGEAYNFVQEPVVPDVELTVHYEDNGLFAKIIDTPAEEALKHGFDLNIKSETVQGFVDKALKALKFANKAATAIKWARLYGGSIIVMLIDDGRGLEEPLDWKNIRSIDELRVYERAVVQPDYASLYIQDPAVPGKNRTSKFGMPEFYDVHSLYGSFRVHESRCLVFRNGILPERVTNPVYRFWGTPEYVRIKRAMRDALTTHGNGPKLLDRSVQPVYKMKDLAAILAAEGGDDIVMKRLKLIDLARSILNSIAIDKDGEEYDFKSFTLTGVKDVIDASCNMLSAVTNIPQAILFGRSPAGENSTGESDFENYYNYVDKIRSLMLEDNLQYLLDILFYAGVANREVDEAPDYDLEFNPLWSLSETEQANVDKLKADTEFVRAQTAQLYVGMQAMDPSEVREALRRKEDFTVEEILDDQGEMDDWGIGPLEGPTNAPQLGQQTTPANPQDAIQTGSGGFGSTFPVTSSTNQADAMPTSAATLVVKDGKLLIGTRKDSALVCGPGGHIEDGETPEDAARREAIEEFGIRLGQLDRLGQIDGLPEKYGTPVIFLCTQFDGEPKADGKEMRNARFASLPELKIYQRFLPFKRSIELLESCIEGISAEDGGPGSGHFGHEGNPGHIGGSIPKGGGPSEKRERVKRDIASKESAKKCIRDAAKKLADAEKDVDPKNSTAVTKAFFESIGYTGLPSIRKKEDFEAVESEFPTLYRGVETKEQYDQYVNGEAFIGRGDMGNGTNSTTSEREATYYAEEGGRVLKIKLAPGAKVISKDDLVADIRELRAEAAKLGNDKENAILRTMLYDPACYAAALGYDAISGFDDWFNIINRTAAIVEE